MAVGTDQARARLIARLVDRVDADGGIREECGSRVVESALFAMLLERERTLPFVRNGVTAYLKAAAPRDEGSRILRDAALGMPDLVRAGAFFREFSHGTGARKQRLLRMVFALFALVPFEDGPAEDYRGHATWTELSLCASKILHDHAYGRANPADHAYLVAKLASAPPGRVWEANVFAHLVALHALHTFQPGGMLIRQGITAVTASRRPDGGVPFITGQDVFVTAVAGLALAAGGRASETASRMADWIVSRQQLDGGWGYTTETTQTDVDDTTRCLELLRAVGGHRESIDRGNRYLLGMVGPDGGFPTYRHGHPPDADMTANAIIVLGPEPRHRELLDTSVRFLRGCQLPDGAFERAWTESESSVINRVAEALTRDPGATVHRAVHRLHESQNTDGGWGRSPGDPSDVLATAQAIPVIARHGIRAVLDRAVRYLLAQQDAAGGFHAPPDQVGPRPLPFDYPILADVHALFALNAALCATARATGPRPRTLPAYYCPFPPARHPLTDVAEERSIAWMRSFGLGADELQRQRAAETGGGRGGYMAPTASPEGLQLVSDWNLWIVLFDDEYCDEGPLGSRPGELANAVFRMQRCVEVSEERFDPADRYGMALRDLRRRLDQHVSPAHAHWFAETMRCYFLAEIHKAGYLARSERPRLDDYVLVRLYGAGSMIYPELEAMVSGCLPAPEILASRRVRALTECAAFLAVLASDFPSHAKERERSGDGFNLIDVLRLEHGCTEDEAYERGMVLWDRIMSLFLRLRADLTARCPELIGYTDSLAQHIRGAIDWCLASGRYLYPHGADGPRAYVSGGFRDQPRDSSSTPPSLPSISWWWQHDPARSKRKLPAE